MHTEKLEPHWKTYESEDTEILVVHGLQVASIQPADIPGLYEVYIYDSDFDELFRQLDGTQDKDKKLLKNLVGRLFLDWLDKCYKEFSS